MTLYILKRVVSGAVCLALVTVFVFVAMRFVPGDVVSVQLQNATGVSEEQAELLREQFGLNDPVYVQFFDWVGGVFRGDLGASFWSGEPAVDILAERVPITLQIGAFALVLAIVAGVGLGVIAARLRGTWVDGATRVGAVVGLSVPHYVIALLILVTLSNVFRWSPPLIFSSIGEDPVQYFQQAGIPIIALALMTTAGIARMTRSSMLEAISADSVRAVRARGGGEWDVIGVHALRNSGIPILTLVGLELGAVLGGTVILETLFAIPGVGSLTYEAVASRDYPLVVVCTIFYCVMYLVVTIVIDLAYAWIDPRIRTAGVGR